MLAIRYYDQFTCTEQEARAAFIAEHGKEIKQLTVRDEEGYQLPAKLQRLPLSTYSRDCQLNLHFTYESNLTQAALEPVEAGSAVVTTATGSLRDWMTGGGGNRGTPPPLPPQPAAGGAR